MSRFAIKIPWDPLSYPTVPWDRWDCLWESTVPPEGPGNAEKGLSQRFLWLFPEPVYAEFDNLEPIDTDFTDKIGKLCVNYCKI